MRKVSAGTGLITTIAGNGYIGYNGDGISATVAEMFYAYGVAWDPSGNLFIADASRIRKVTFSSAAATPPITWPTPAAIVYGTALSGTQLDATSTVAGTFVYSPAAGAVLAAGTQTLSVTFNPTNTSAYTTAMDTVQLTVNKASQTITFPAPASPVVNGVAPITLSATGGASGNPVTFSVVSGPGTVSGTNGHTLTVTGVGTIVVAANQAGNADYAAAAQVTHSIVVESAAAAVLTSPTPSSTLTGPTVNFAWTAVAGATSYELWLGSTVGSASIYNSGHITATAATVRGVPTNGETIYARLYTTVNGNTTYSDATYTAATQAAFTSPMAGAQLTGPTVTFHWAASASATSYELWLGSTGVGSANLYNSGGTTATSVTVRNLPTNGQTIYALLYTTFNGVTVHANYTFTAE